MIHNGYGEEDHTMSPESCRRDLKPRVIPNYGNIGEGRSEKDSQARAHKSLQLMQPTLTVWSPSVSDKSEVAERGACRMRARRAVRPCVVVVFVA